MIKGTPLAVGLGQGKAMKGPNPQCLWVWHLAVVLVERLEPSHTQFQSVEKNTAGTF